MPAARAPSAGKNAAPGLIRSAPGVLTVIASGATFPEPVASFST